MNTKHLTAPGAVPFFLFISKKVSYATFLYGLEVVEHAHAILCSIAFIQMVQPCAWKAVTTEAVFDFSGYHRLTVLNAAQSAGLRFETVVTPAAGACVLVTNISVTKAAVHSAGGNVIGITVDLICVMSVCLSEFQGHHA